MRYTEGGFFVFNPTYIYGVMIAVYVFRPTYIYGVNCCLSLAKNKKR